MQGVRETELNSFPVQLEYKPKHLSSTKAPEWPVPPV